MRLLGLVTVVRGLCLAARRPRTFPGVRGKIPGPAASRDERRRVPNAKGWLIFKGNVDPGWNNRNVQIYKRLCQGCEWTLVKKTRTDGSGRWRTRIYAPRTGYWFWKGLVPKTGGYGKSVTKIYRTYVT